MNLPKLDKEDIIGKRIIVRADLDVDAGKDNKRLEILVSTLSYILEKQAKIIIIGHKGRPAGRLSLSLSLRNLTEPLGKIIGKKIKFIADIDLNVINLAIKQFNNTSIFLLENLRFDKREEENDREFAKMLASFGDFYVNEAFGASHREHASIGGVPKFLPHAAGFHFAKEVEALGRVLEDPKKPVVVIIGGVKEDKLEYVPDFEKFANKILIGGRLPDFINQGISNFQFPISNEKILVAGLNSDKEDITLNSIEEFEAEIAKAGTVVLIGPMGKFEDKDQRLGTKRVFEAVARSKAYSVVGGGDTEEAIKVLSVVEGFDWVSVGGGATLQFLAKGTLPGIGALLR